jgi:hypothetical protein
VLASASNVGASAASPSERCLYRRCMWCLLRLWHVESLESVIEHPQGIIFTRTSYLTAPARWRELSVPVLASRLEQLLDAAYKARAHTLAGSGDDTQMLWFGFYYEWVDHGVAVADSTLRSDLWTQPRAGAHPSLVAKAHDEVDAALHADRPGIAGRCYATAFEAFRIDEDDSWHLVGFNDRAGLFAERHPAS